MASMDSKRLCTQDAATVRMFDETLKYKPITFARKPEAASGHSVGLVEKAIAVLLPLTEPRKAKPCENATAVAMLTKLSVMSRGSVMGHYENVWSTVQAKCPDGMKMMID